MAGIRFWNVRRSPAGLVEIDADVDGTVHELRFDLGVAHVPADDLVALALGMLSGRKFERVAIEGLRAPASCRKVIETLTGATVEIEEGPAPERDRGTTPVLGFSGGFDSLTALLMMPPGHKLYSFDFGGKFARERPFFERFDTRIVETNLVDEGFNRFHWEFMYTAPVLLHDLFRTDYLAMGSIFGMAAQQLLTAEPGKGVSPTLAQQYLGITPYSPVQGLTEIGTAGLVLEHYPELVVDSLKSLANLKEGKYTRKILSLWAYQASQGQDLWPELPKAGPWYQWGKGFTEDFISMFMIKHLGIERVQAIYKTPIPAEAVEVAMDLSLEFYLKVYPAGSLGRDDEFVPLVEAITGPTLRGGYEAADREELTTVVELLQRAAGHPA